MTEENKEKVLETGRKDREQAEAQTMRDDQVQEIVESREEANQTECDKCQGYNTGIKPDGSPLCLGCLVQEEIPNCPHCGGPMWKTGIGSWLCKDKCYESQPKEENPPTPPENLHPDDMPEPEEY